MIKKQKEIDINNSLIITESAQNIMNETEALTRNKNELLTLELK